MSDSPPDFFTKDMAQSYDDRNSKLAPISDGLHFLMSLVLESAPSDSKVLSVGTGTGAEILSLAKVFPKWTFVAVEPSQAMLSVCKQRLEQAGFSDRCEFIHGYTQDLSKELKYDVALSILVAHFIKKEDRQKFYSDITSRLRNGGFFVNAEISFDLNSIEYSNMLNNWKTVQRLMGGTPESLSQLPTLLKNSLSVLPPSDVKNVIEKSNIEVAIRFYQAFMISAWYGIKS